MGLRFAAADAALFLEMVCCNVALSRYLCFVGSMGSSSAAPAAVLFLGWQRAANGVLASVFAFCWFRSIGPVVPAAALFFEIVCCNVVHPWCLRLVLVIPALPCLTLHQNTKPPFPFRSVPNDTRASSFDFSLVFARETYATMRP
ncbi:hypothetical protein ARMGADRAFT_1087935 [Armillaria gallica]|uniref:Uncharacterized protein n=1 Tax=Armillaria gallica TaxID=47427 RepID=A0A2H3CPR5_ARMGA|nr:hypothetical protein ARMGADRAFT_1087935 [Armillaria gallica]